MPTLLELCGARAAHEIDGRSLAPLLRGEAGPAREAFSEVRWKFGDDLASLRRDPWKFIGGKRGAETVEMLFDHSVDPAEAKDVLAQHPDVAAEMRLALRARLERARAMGSRYERQAISDLTPAEQERLKGLGYTGEAK
jgi:arylsulfatase A-like enzyme